MLIVGERLNTSRKDVLRAFQEGNASFLQEEARKQSEAGATLIDINAGMMMEREAPSLEWAVKVVQDTVDLPISLDSSNPAAIERALKVHRGQAMINSISLEEDRYRDLIDLVVEGHCLVVALCLDEQGFPNATEQRMELASRLVARLTGDKVPADHIWIDPLVTSLSTDSNAGTTAFETIGALTSKNLKTIVGLSNISFFMPARKQINRSFLALALARGLSAAIMDPLDRNLLAALHSSELLLGHDEFCLGFIDAFRKGKFGKE